MAGNITEKPLTVNVNFGKLFLKPRPYPSAELWAGAQ